MPQRPLRPCVPLLCLSLALAACERAPGGPTAAVARDSAGVKIVESTAPHWREGEAWTVATRPAVDIGVVDGPPEYQLDRVVGALRLADGRMVVANAGSAELRFYDPAGKHQRSVGRQGGGPGEFRRLVSVALAGDSLLAFDAALERVSTFDLQGELKETLKLQPPGSPTHPLRLYELAGWMGNAGLLLLPRAFPADMSPQPVQLWDTVPNLLYGRDGILRDTVGEFSGMDLFATPERSGRPLFGRFTQSHLQNGRLYITDGGRYEVRVYGSDGTLQRIVRLKRDVRPVTGDDVEALTNAFLARASSEDQRMEIQRSVEARPRTEYKPWISEVLVDELDHLWVREYHPQREDSGRPHVWSVFDPEGRFLGSLELPGRFRPTQIGREYVLGVARDDVDVEHVQLYPITRTAGAR